MATPNYELRSFLNLCGRLDFDPVILTYHRDRMICHNVYRRSLLILCFVEKLNKSGQPIWCRRKIGSIDQSDNKRLIDIEVAGQSLPLFHQRILVLSSPGRKIATIDGSLWFGGYPNGAREYYVDIFQGLTGNSVLVEDFTLAPKKHAFFRRLLSLPSALPRQTWV